MQSGNEYRRHLARMRAELWKIRQMVDAIDPWHKDYRYFGMVPETGEMQDVICESVCSVHVDYLKSKGVHALAIECWKISQEADGVQKDHLNMPILIKAPRADFPFIDGFDTPTNKNGDG